MEPKKTLPLPSFISPGEDTAKNFRLVRFGVDDFRGKGLGLGNKQKQKKNPYDLPIGRVVQTHHPANPTMFWQFGTGGDPSKTWQTGPERTTSREETPPDGYVPSDEYFPHGRTMYNYWCLLPKDTMAEHEKFRSMDQYFA
jgi:hypothetical protein